MINGTEQGNCDMGMKVIIAPPPNYGLLCKHFAIVNRRDVIFCYGDAIWNPHGVNVDDSLHAHEAVHSKAQGRDPDAWWARYIAEPEFRLAQELPAHQAEYRVLAADLTRNQRRVVLRTTARKLCAPLYGKMISHHAAMNAIRGEVNLAA